MLGYDEHLVKNYQHAIETIQTDEKILLLYERAYSYVLQAKTAIQKNHSKDAYEPLDKASKIVNGLRESIDVQTHTYELGKQLNDFYNAIDATITSIQSTHNVESCEQVMTNLKVLSDAWEQHVMSAKRSDSDRWVNIKDLRTTI